MSMKVIVVHRDERGYGLTLSGDNPVYVQSVKDGELWIGINYILFTKLPWPRDSEETFRPLSQAATCSSVSRMR